jgi:myo-inositol 2-dehydrogenase / D-chiro-inositol 1-dehydrogenase
MTGRQADVTRTTRRDFLKTTAVAGTALAANLSQLANAHAAGSDTLRVGLIGCGGRGTQAAENVLSSAPGVKVVAIGDVFEEKLKYCQGGLKEFASKDETVKKHGNAVDIPDERCFLGLDAYDKVIGSGIDYVILATPPGFRPIHLQAAVAAGKHIFTEKPVGVDGPGIRKVLAAYEEAKGKHLGVAAGTQRRHQLGYLETLKRIHDGSIGDITGGRCYWMQGILWKRERRPGMSDVAYQVNNWYGFPWLSGDHIVEQHVHNIDVMNWALGTHPVSAVGMGYRTPRDKGYGVIYDFFAIDFQYPNGVHVLSMCRQISNCRNEIGEYLVGKKGHCHVNEYSINDRRVVSRQQDRDSTNPYVQEHTDLIESIRSGKPINELKNVAESTLTAILGRMSAYTGKQVSWDQALHSQQSLMPEHLDWHGSLPVAEVAAPGKTPLV